MAIKEFEFGPQEYFEANYMSGDYTAPGIVRTLLQCDVDQIYGGIVLTGEYYEGEYIDGTYFHDNSVKSAFSVDVTRIKSFEVGFTDYFEEGYFEESGYSESRGSVFAISIEGGIVKDAQADFGALFTPTMSANAIKNSFSIMDAVFTPTVDANATFVANQITLDSIINQSLMDDTRIRTFTTLSTSTVNGTTFTTTTLNSNIFIDYLQVDITRGVEIDFNSNFLQTTNTVKTTDIESNQTVSVAFSCDAEKVILSDATLATTSDILIRPISYKLRTLTNRPYTSFEPYMVLTDKSIIQPTTGGGLEKYYNNDMFLMDDTYADGTTGHQAYTLPFLESRQTAYNQWYNSDFYVSFYYETAGSTLNTNNYATIFRLGTNVSSFSGSYVSYSPDRFDIKSSQGQDSYYGAEAIEVIAVRTGDYTPPSLRVDVTVGTTTHTITSSVTANGLISISRSGNTITVKRNGTTVGTATVSGDLRLWRYIGLYPNQETHYVDHRFNNVILQKGSSVAPYNNLNNEYTFARYTFNNTLDDVTTGFLESSGSLIQNVNATITAVPNAVKDGVTIHLGTSTLDITTNVLKPVTVDILSDSNVTAQGDLVVTMNPATHSAEFNTTIDNARARVFNSSINVLSNAVPTATRIRPLDATFDSIATTLNAVNKIGNTLTDFESGVFSTTVSADRLQGLIEEYTAATTVEAESTRIKPLDIDAIEILSAVVADINYRPDVFMDNGGLGTLTADVERTRDVDSDITAVATFIPFVSGVREYDANITANTTQITVGEKTATVESNISSTLTFICGASLITDVQANIQANIQAITSINRIRRVETTFDSIASTASAVAKIGDFLINLESAFTLNTEITKTSGVGAIIDSVTTVETTPYRLIDRQIDAIDVSTSIVANGTLGTDVVAPLQVVTAFSSDVNTVTQSSATLVDAVSFAMTAKVSRDGDIDADSNFSFTIQPNITRETDSSFEVVSATTADAVKNTGIIATVSSQVDVSVDAKVIVIDSITYTIPKETRVFTINSEDREYTIQFEQRETTIGA